MKNALSPVEWTTAAIAAVTASPRAATSHSVYRQLAVHQATEDEWVLRDLFAHLHEWAGVFIAEFKLGLSAYAIGVDALPLSTLGRYRDGHDGHGLRASITLNRLYVEGPLARPYWDVLGTLLHELLHAWQEAHGTPGRGNHHNRQFRDFALALGLVINEHGHQEYLPGGRFLRLLEERGVEVPHIEPPKPPPKRTGSSKLRKYTCGCTNVRVGTSRFSATCNLCGRQFVPAA